MCGLIGIWNEDEAANLAYLALYSQQHRGQEGAGIVSHSSSEAGPAQHVFRGLGLVGDVFHHFDFGRLPGRNAIGHVRYTTAGGNMLANVQPFSAELAIGQIAIAHNGNLINTDQLRRELIQQGAIFSSTSDTEVFLHLIARAPRHTRPVESVISALHRVKGAYSLLVLFSDRLIAVRDPNGLRPLVIGRRGDGLLVASETCAFDLVGAEFVREVEPGELIEISGNNDIRSYRPFAYQRETPCIFEFIYFARPDSQIFGANVYEVRKEFGRELAREHPASATMVIPVPDSGMTAALGYAEESGIRLELGLIRNHYVGRTFIEPQQSIRDFGVKIKLNPNSAILRDQSVVIVDDSIVRGTTCRKLVAMLRHAGAKEVHMRISAPPTVAPCHYGIDTPTEEELIASHKSVDEIRQFIGCDSLGYLSVPAMYRAVKKAGRSFCDACFSKQYPIGTPSDHQGKQFELFNGNSTLKVV